jgi:hypothetical protein
MASMVEDLAVTVIMPDGSSPRLDPPDDIGPMLRTLRQVTYEDVTGAWYAMRLTLDPPASYVVNYNFGSDPLWDPPLPPEVYRRDLEAFPRRADMVPSWYRMRMEESPQDGGIGGDQDTVLRRIADELKFLLPSGWQYVQITCDAGDGQTGIATVVHSVLGGVFPWHPPAVISDAFAALRVAPGKWHDGDWHTVVFEMRPRGAFRAAFNRAGQWPAGYAPDRRPSV